MFSVVSVAFRMMTVGVIVALAACAGSTTVEKLYQDPAARELTFNRILVVSVASDGGERRQMEELVSSELAERIDSAIPSYKRLGLASVITQDALDMAAEAAEADAILITHVVSVSTSAEVQEGRVDIKSECRGGNPADYFLYDHEELRQPDSVSFAHEVVVVSNLYRADTGTRLWTIQSTCVDKAELESVMADEARAIVRQLRRDGLIG
ncbi:MAG TPA: hypothetical protein VKZ91_05640 [Woeseiaceae bacterium]|nr:hypothetical protein [Woeseiaceae bacterium]